MKVTAYCLGLLFCFCMLFAYGLADREYQVDYEALTGAKLVKVSCGISTYSIMMPSFEGFTLEDTEKLEDSFKQ